MIAILNTSILPSGRDHVALAVTIDPNLARRLAATGIRSHVGHESTARIATSLLGVEVAMDRTPWNPEYEDGTGDVSAFALVIQLRGRPPEGTILSAEEVERIGYDIRLMLVTRTYTSMALHLGALDEGTIPWAGRDPVLAGDVRNALLSVWGG